MFEASIICREMSRGRFTRARTTPWWRRAPWAGDVLRGASVASVPREITLVHSAHLPGVEGTCTVPIAIVASRPTQRMQHASNQNGGSRRRGAHHGTRARRRGASEVVVKISGQWVAVSSPVRVAPAGVR